jgi:hypothetical protein
MAAPTGVAIALVSICSRSEIDLGQAVVYATAPRRTDEHCQTLFDNFRFHSWIPDNFPYMAVWILKIP